MSDESSENINLLTKLHSETAIIDWRELQRFFAQGLVLHVADSLDLVQIAVYFAEDDTQSLKPYMRDGDVGPPSNEKARAWYDLEAQLWSVVVAPFVLVQENSKASAGELGNNDN